MGALWHGYAERSLSLPFVPLALLATLARLLAAGDALPKQRVVELGGGLNMVFLLIPPATFTMGSTEEQLRAVRQKWPETEEDWVADEKPAHKVTISEAFYMGKLEVTVAQFRRFVEAAGYKTAVLPALPWRSWHNQGFKQTDQHAVTCVSWNGAHKFAEWLNASDKAKPVRWTHRLPTEAEWEYAARGPQSLVYPWGNAWEQGRCNAADKWVSPWDRRGVDDGYPRTAPVGSFSPRGDSPFGLSDMAGNVSEWCEDSHGPYKEGDQTDPTAPADGETHVLRGGSWYHPPRLLRSASRLQCVPASADDYFGFRLVLAPGPK